jgi:hypothetical protein
MYTLKPLAETLERFLPGNGPGTEATSPTRGNPRRNSTPREITTTVTCVDVLNDVVYVTLLEGSVLTFHFNVR